MAVNLGEKRDIAEKLLTLQSSATYANAEAKWDNHYGSRSEVYWGDSLRNKEVDCTGPNAHQMGDFIVYVLNADISQHMYDLCAEVSQLRAELAQLRARRTQ